MSRTPQAASDDQDRPFWDRALGQWNWWLLGIVMAALLSYASSTPEAAISAGSVEVVLAAIVVLALGSAFVKSVNLPTA